MSIWRVARKMLEKTVKKSHFLQILQTLAKRWGGCLRKEPTRARYYSKGTPPPGLHDASDNESSTSSSGSDSDDGSDSDSLSGWSSLDLINESIQSQVLDTQKVVEKWQQRWGERSGESASLLFCSVSDIDTSTDDVHDVHDVNDDVARDEDDQGKDNEDIDDDAEGVYTDEEEEEEEDNEKESPPMEETVGVLVTANGGKVTTMETLTEELVKLYPSNDSFYYHHSYDDDDDSDETDTDSDDDNLDKLTLK